MKKLVASLLILALGFVTAGTQLVRADVPRALEGIDPSETEPISNAQAQEIRGDFVVWVAVMAGLSLAVATYIYWKIVTGRPLTPIEQSFVNEF